MRHILETKIPVLSFYSGGGFLDMGFEEAGFEIVWTNEYDKIFAQFHSEGITAWRKSRGNGIRAEIFNTKSIEDVSNDEILQEAFPNGKPEIFGIIGGPPCQDFSMNGNLEGFGGARGKLTIIFLEKIKALLPSFFVIENVTGLTKNIATREELQKLLNPLREHYDISQKTLNALDFGVPQSRQRVFIVGFNKDKFKFPFDTKAKETKWFEYLEYSYPGNPVTTFKWPAKTPFGTNPQPPEGVPIELCVQNCLVHKNEEDTIPNASEYCILKVSTEKLEAIQEGETNRHSFKRLHRFRYSPTACYGNNEVHLHPYKNRRLSVRETLRIQGVPDSYVLSPKIHLTKKFKMIGNGVPVPLAFAVAKAVKKYFINIALD